MVISFGTDGVRGEANHTLLASVAYRIGRFMGQYPNGRVNKILLARDTRLSGEMYWGALVAGVLASGGELYDEGISTTPSISYLVKAHHFDYGIMISASHNPFSDNGIKVFNGDGEKLDSSIEEKVELCINRPEDDLPFPSGALVGHYHAGDYLRKEYTDWLVSKASGTVKGLKVLVDCANGSASSLAPFIYSKLGLAASFIHAEPNGVNINDSCGSTHLESLKKEMPRGDYDLGFSFDGDADRFMAITKAGRLIDGDALIYLSALALRKQNLLSQNKVVITVMSNFGLRKALEEAKIAYETVQVGDRNVQQKLKEDGLSLGGEQSGHVIFLGDLNTGDGLLSSIKLLNLFADDKETFEQLAKLKSYPQILVNIRIASLESVDSILKDPDFLALIKKQELRLQGDGRILVRQSGTEPLIRVMVESLDDALCHDVCDQIVDYINTEAKLCAESSLVSAK